MNSLKNQHGINALLVVGLFAVIAILASAAYFGMKISPQFGAATTTTPAPTVVETPEPSGTMIDAKDTSDEALDKDTEDEDKKLKELDEDSKNIDGGLNDKQSDLSE